MNPRSMVRDYGGNCGNWSPKNYSGGSSGRSLAALDAFRMSLNIPAVNVSLQYGREKVVEMTQRLGVVGVKKTCSMALGDTGITPLQHTGAFAHFANGGKTARPYGILEMFNSKGDLIYSRDRDEPPPAQVVSRRVVEDMNQMMLAVVTNGTAQKAALDFATVVGKTGTSSSYRDAWFVGFTGALVTGVWVGYDDFRPMPGITGGSLPAQAWHSYMQVAHKNYPAIPPIPGLGLHPNQVADQQRLIDLKRTDPGMAQAQMAQAAQRPSSLMPDQTQSCLEEARRHHAAGRRRAADACQCHARQRAARRQPSAAAPAAPGAPKARPPEPKAKPPTGATGAACRSARRWRAPAAVILSDRGPDGEIAA